MDVASVEQRRQVAATDLVRRPPEPVQAGRSLAAAARDVGLHVQGGLAREQLASEHRPERLRRTGGAEAMGDVRGRRVCLLGRQAALLEREVGAIARGIDVLRASQARMLVDREEAAIVGRKPVDGRALHRGQGDDHVGIDLPVTWREDQRVALLVGALPGEDLDPAGAEQLRDG